MSSTTITNFRANAYDYVSSVVLHNEVVDISTKHGNAIVISKDDYNAIMETLNVLTIPGIDKKIAEAESDEDLTPLSEVVW